MSEQYPGQAYFHQHNPNIRATEERALDESDRQLVLMALSELALSKPGFDEALALIAKQFNGEEMFEAFKKYRADALRGQP